MFTFVIAIIGESDLTWNVWCPFEILSVLSRRHWTTRLLRTFGADNGMWSAKSRNILFCLFRIHLMNLTRVHILWYAHSHAEAKDLIERLLWWLQLYWWNEDFSAKATLTSKWFIIDIFSLSPRIRYDGACARVINERSTKYSAYRIAHDFAGSTFAPELHSNGKFPSINFIQITVIFAQSQSRSFAAVCTPATPAFSWYFWLICGRDAHLETISIYLQ